MPKFAVLRDLPPSLTRADLDGMAIESVIAQDLYNGFCRHYGRPGGTADLADYAANTSGQEDAGPVDLDSPDGAGVRWIRSYWAPGTSWAACLYEAGSIAELRNFQTSCQLDGGIGFREVTELANPGRTDDAGRTIAPPDGWDLVSMDIPMDESNPTIEAVAPTMNAAAAKPPLRNGIAARWVRAYWPSDAESPNQEMLEPNGSEPIILSLFAAPAPAVRALRARPDAHRVVEVTPQEYR